MTPEQTKLVQDSFQAAAALGADNVAQLFYKRLFELDPSLRHLFKEDMSEQRQKLMQMLTVAIRGLQNPDALLAPLRALGERHSAYGVVPKHYETVGAALLDTLAAGLGPAFDPETKDAWVACYGLVSTVMLGATPANSGKGA
jgi:hemoglobin-like flavoprotein